MSETEQNIEGEATADSNFSIPVVTDSQHEQDRVDLDVKYEDEPIEIKPESLDEEHVEEEHVEEEHVEEKHVEGEHTPEISEEHLSSEMSDIIEEEIDRKSDDLKDELSKIKVFPPVSEPLSELYNLADFPNTYQDNTPKEALLLQYSDNFKRQYVQLYSDRKPLLLDPINECGCKKFVSTTIRATLLPYREFYEWDTTAEFVADYLDFKPLDVPYEVPSRMVSPTTVMKKQLGHCFEYSTLLCSLLIGAGYDAYVVSGYASREICFCNNTADICSLLIPKVEEVKVEMKEENFKYQVKPPKDLTSKFIRKMEERKITAEKKVIEDERHEQEMKRLEEEKPPPDPLYGLRVHSWVLVLAGKREVPESFFIEPLNGQSHDLKFDGYQGIESIWNHHNYWVNMQDCAEGVLYMDYDLGDCVKWEFLLPGYEKSLLQLPEVVHEDVHDILDDEEEEDEMENYLDMPVSWVEPLTLTLREFETRCPKGKKTRLFKKAKVEKYAPYLMPDGLVCRVSTFSNRDMTNQLLSKEMYDHRMDKLHTRDHDLVTGQITEHFSPGRPRCLKEHEYNASNPDIENNRTMKFYHNARVDGLDTRIETPTMVTEHYVNRDDFLYFVEVEFARRTRRLMPQEGQPFPRTIEKMTQKFNRNPAKKANDDIAELIFYVNEDRIYITYHLEDDRIAASTREYIKPLNWQEKGAIFNLTEDMHLTFQASIDAKPTKRVDQLLLLQKLLQDEQKCKDRIRDSESEVREILEARMTEIDMPQFEISVYDVERNEKAKKHRQELDRMMEEAKLRKQEMEIDYLAPFLAQLGHPEKLSRTQAYHLKDECLLDLKQRLIDRANLIQARFEKETQELQKKQTWYQQNQMSMQKVDEEEYLNFCSESMFRIHILELRLNRHKEMAPHKYMAMEQKLRCDPRLEEFFT